MNCSKLILATALFISVGAFAKPVVIGEPKKGTPITTIQDGKEKVEITTTGIIVDDGKDDTDDAKDEEAAAAATTESGRKKGDRTAHFKFETSDNQAIVGIVVPIAFFLLILCSILGVKYFSSRNEQKRLELLKLMVEKGQPVPDSVVNSILAPQPEVETDRTSYKRYRNAYGFSIFGFLLMTWAMLTRDYDGGAMICGLIFLCIGAGGLAGLYLPKRNGNGTQA